MGTKALASAIILAGGSGTRFKHPGGKQTVIIGDKPMLTWSLKAFDDSQNIAEMIVVCPKDKQDEYVSVAIEPFQFKTPIKLAEAGTIRQESAFHGLEATADDLPIVAIHDGARPHITTETIDHAINELKGNYEIDGAIVGFPCIDTIKVLENGLIAGTPDRSALWTAHTPQVFRKAIYKEAHIAALADGFVGTDDSSLVERLGGRIAAINGTRNNIKLTIPEDYELLISSLRTMLKSSITIEQEEVSE
ncbi:MAG: 2-C-methyl-D-erythritol 4-phosphate cytidylyltransferase [Phoenicibacter congonensis]|uniref:2-C-methyl-D-erythritol 4-phosphate cytidylyltransferase n=1 Tax=Phoenicibacter congonensis TaxID=1944646 RepID=A0AA43UB67_9ACTN|nr:2-C-methyl-D-erythritol 4-phosphate cytidylyltransferase [Phoenicibacter congonensis]